MTSTQCDYGGQHSTPECWFSPCEKHLAERKLETDMREKFIIPNWYKPSHFKQMKDWDEQKIRRFKDYLSKDVCACDGVREYVEEVLEKFIHSDEEDSDEEGISDVEEVVCTDENRCEECTHCARTRPCECGCSLIGGSCLGERLTDEDSDEWESKAEWWASGV